VINQQGEKVRRKLAWYSTVTGHCLFVNQRGVRTDEKTLHQLALDVVHGQAIIVEPEQESLVDRAWKAVMNSLRQLIGREPAPKPAESGEYRAPTPPQSAQARRPRDSGFRRDYRSTGRPCRQSFDRRHAVDH